MVFPPGTEPVPSAVEVESHNHWTTREVPSLPLYLKFLSGFPGGSDGKESACNAGYLGLIPEWGRPPQRRE